VIVELLEDLPHIGPKGTVCRARMGKDSMLVLHPTRRLAQRIPPNKVRILRHT